MPPVHSEVLEDEQPIRAWLQAGPGDTAVSIASAGDNVFHLALDQPAKVFGVDISPAQIEFCRLKTVALDVLSEGELASLMGTHPGSCPDRGELIARMLRAADTHFPAGDARSIAEQRGILHIGIFDRLVGVVRDQIHQAVGTDIIHRIVSEPSRAERVKTWDEHDLTSALTPVVQEFFNEDVLDDVFTPKQHRDILVCSPFPEHLLRAIRRLVLDADPGQNYYLHRWALGGYFPDGRVPPYLDPGNQLPLRRVLPRIEWVSAGLPDFLHQLPRNSTRCFNLSNVLDWCDDDYAQDTWQAITRASCPGARVFVRSFLAVRAHHQTAASLGWSRNQEAEDSCLAIERVGYYPAYELWSRA